MRDELKVTCHSHLECPCALQCACVHVGSACPCWEAMSPILCMRLKIPTFHHHCCLVGEGRSPTQTVPAAHACFPVRGEKVFMPLLKGKRAKFSSNSILEFCEA